MGFIRLLPRGMSVPGVIKCGKVAKWEVKWIDIVFKRVSYPETLQNEIISVP